MKYPIGLQNFREIRKNGCLYVDKTGLVYRMAHNAKYYFLSRPRRFGKSLLVSTLETYFRGQKEYFEGLAMENLENEWIEYPVLHLDLNAGNYQSVEYLKNKLNLKLSEWERIYGHEPEEREPEDRFGGIIRRACEKTGRNVVILVDEYDKPLLQNIDNEPLQQEIRAVMKAFFSQLKSQDGYIRFALLTGVTKFSKVSIFSDLNNLIDITLSPAYETLCGISQKEVDHYFSEALIEIAEANNCTSKEAREKLAKKYDGYHFSRRMTDMYNPFSLLNAFDSKFYGNFWFETATPSFLIKLLRKNDIEIDKLDNMRISERALGNVDTMLKNPVPVLFQSGYLTIKGYDPEEELYTLGFPNLEVSDGFFNSLLPYYANIEDIAVEDIVSQLRTAIRAGEIDRFMLILQAFFAGYDYSLIPRKDLERHYQNVIYAVCKLIGLRVKAEYHTSNGRIDMLIETKDSVYVFEFKLNAGTTPALQQIQHKDYTAQFAAGHRKVYKIGVNFDSSIRGIKDWKVEV